MRGVVYGCAVRGPGACPRVGVDVLVDSIYYLLDRLRPFFHGVYSVYTVPLCVHRHTVLRPIIPRL
jgi:hypothetical protein